jgi:hypothetical protein
MENPVTLRNLTFPEDSSQQGIQKGDAHGGFLIELVVRDSRGRREMRSASITQAHTKIVMVACVP